MGTVTEIPTQKQPDGDEVAPGLRLVAETLGHAIMGLPHRRAKVYPGDTFHHWGGFPLPARYSLIVIGQATREDWAEQWRLLFPGKEDMNAQRATERFFRCAIRHEGKALMKRGEEHGW